MIEKLGIYKSSYELTSKIYTCVPHMEKMHKHLIGVKMLNSSINLFSHIAMANKTKDKKERLGYINDFLIEFESLRVMLKICNDFKLLKLNSLTDMFLIVEDINTQLSAWRNKTTSGMSQAEAPTV